MAPTVISTFPITQASPTTSSFTPQTGDVIVFVGASGNGGTRSWTTPSGGGWTYTSRVSVLNASRVGIQMWTAPVTAGGTAQTVTAGETGSGNLEAVVYLVRGGQVGTGATHTQSGTNQDAITTASGSLVLSVIGCFSGTTGSTPVSPGTLDRNSSSSGSSCSWVEQATSSSGSQAYGITPLDSALTWDTAAVEIQAGTVAGPPPVRPAAPGKTWLRRFRHRQAALGSPFAPSVAAQAGVAVVAAAAPGGAPPAPSSGNFVPGRAEPGQAVPGRPFVAGLTVATGVQSFPPAAGGASPGRTWARLFKHRQRLAPPGPAAAGAAAPNAGAAVATVAANQPVAAVAAASPAAAAGAVANAPAPAVGANGAVAVSAVTAPQPGVAATANAGAAAVAATANQPVTAITVFAGVAIVGVVANQPTVSTVPTVNAPAGVAVVAVAANQPVAAITVFAGVAIVGAVAPQPTVSTSGGINAPAAVAAIGAAANQPVTAVTVFAAVAIIGAVAPAAAGQTAKTPAAGVATVGAAALAPALALAVAAQAAAVAAAAAAPVFAMAPLTLTAATTATAALTAADRRAATVTAADQKAGGPS